MSRKEFFKKGFKLKDFYLQCLSPSHAALSYSLYNQYKTWRKENNLSHEEFKGFSSNRFGRTSFLASLYLEHQADLRRFFADCIDENSNLLVAALSGYFESEWFTVGCKVRFFHYSDII